MTRRLAVIACLGLAALVAAPPAMARTFPKGPTGLRFYKPPKHLGAGKHGDVIWARKIASPLSEASRTYLVLYRSKSIRSKAIGVSGTLMLPRGKAPKRGWPV